MAQQELCVNEKNVAAPGTGINSASNGGAVAAAEGTTGVSATAASESSTSKNLMQYADSFASSVEQKADAAAGAFDSLTNAINGIDCSQEVMDFLMSFGPISAAASFIDKGAKWLNGLTSGTTISSAVQDADIVKKVCSGIEWFYSTIDGYIDIFIKGTFVIFKKIDAARERLENALLDLTEALQYCIMDVINSLRDKLTGTLSTAIAIDWSTLAEFMGACPCLTEVIAYLTGCTEDEDGKDISHNAGQVVHCIQQKLSFLDPTKLCVAINDFVEDYIVKYVNMFFGYLESYIIWVFDMLISPFRWLIKKYAQMLSYKINVNGFIKKVGNFKCFFVYSEEYKGGEKYYGMSIIDMLNTYRQWINCFEFACPGLSAKIQNNIKQRYKDMRLDDKYWRNAREADIYTMCIATELDSGTARESVLRALYPVDPIEWIMSWFRKKKNKDDEDTDDSEEDEIPAVYPTDDEVADSPTGEGGNSADDGFGPDSKAAKKKKLPSKTSMAMQFTDSPDTENDVSSGVKKLDISAMNVLESIAINLGNGGSDYYTEKLYQLLRFMRLYRLSPAFVKTMKEIMAGANSLSGSFSSTTTANVINKPGRASIEYTENHLVPTYELYDDYDKERCERIMAYKFSARGKKEPLLDYYIRMHTQAV